MRMKPLLLISIIIQLSIYCNPKDSNQKESDFENQQNQPEDSISYISRYLVFHTSDTAKNIHIKDNYTNKIVERFKIDSPLYHTGQYFPNHLYILTRTPNNYYLSELWHYTSDKKNKILHTFVEDFKVDPKQNYIAYSESDNNPYDHFSLYNLNTNKIKAIRLTMVSSFSSIYPRNWAITKNEIWGTAYYNFHLYFKYSVDKDHLTLYRAPMSYIEEHCINPDRGLLLYSDYVDDKWDWMKNKPVNLYLYDFNTRNKSRISTNNERKRYTPKWLTPNTFEYYEPSLKKVVQRKIQ